MATNRETYDNRWLTTEEAADYLRLRPETLRRWARQGALPAVKFGNRAGFRFDRDELDLMMERGMQVPSLSSSRG